MRLLFKIALLALGTGVLSAQIQGVISGYVIDSQSGSIRSVLGIPGASRLGEPADLGFRILSGVIRNGRAVVISTEEPAQAYVLRELASRPVARRLPISPSPTARVFLNRSATVALVYSAEAQTIQFVRGLDRAELLIHPPPAFAISTLRGAFVDAAVADSTSCALIGTVDEFASYILKACSGIKNSIATIATLPGVRISSLAWFHGETDAIVADQLSNRILLLPGISGSPIELAGSSPASALIALDDTRIAAISTETPALLVIDTEHAQASRTIALPATPTRLEFLASGGILALTQPDSQPLLLIDMRQDFAPFFVPAK